ncbi:hypothetical protein BGZ80_004412 [Entomortierella chlamydospora]|uniref:Uncharacterized protein n=1 Tax=Entomortierella chlamydospora TaxID=101097 RepID=A0A9P6MNE3_9FUNG|nr:hypothetical protein BGZ80_004412 [Entomortierella chlamydospora]
MKDHSYIYARAINSSPEPAFLAKADLVISLPLTIALGGSSTSTTTPAAPDATTSTSTTSDSSGVATGVPTSATPIPTNPGTSGTSSSGIQTSLSTTSTISTNPENKDSPATGAISASDSAPSSPSSRLPSNSTSSLSSLPSPSSPSSSSSSGHSSNLIVIIGGTLGCLLLMAVLGAVYFYKRHRNLVKKITHQEEDKPDLQSQSNSSKEVLVPSPSLRRNPQEFLEEKSNPDQYTVPDQGQNTRTYRNPQQLP